MVTLGFMRAALAALGCTLINLGGSDLVNFRFVSPYFCRFCDGAVTMTSAALHCQEDSKGKLKDEKKDEEKPKSKGWCTLACKFTLVSWLACAMAMGGFFIYKKHGSRCNVQFSFK